MLVAFGVPAMAQKLAWESQFRSSGGGDQCTSAAVDSSGVYVAGFLGTVGRYVAGANRQRSRAGFLCPEVRHERQ